jgi:hypothetical protein
MAALTPRELRKLIAKTQERFTEIDHADWDKVARRYRTPNSTDKWERAAREIAPIGWEEYIRILAQGWDYYEGSRL